MMSLLVFALNVATDICVCLYIQQVTVGHRMRAGLVSVVIIVLSYCSIIFIVQDTFYIFPAALGVFVGTVLTVKSK